MQHGLTVSVRRFITGLGHLAPGPDVRGGLLKAEAALGHLRVFQRAGIETLEQATALLSDMEAFDPVDKRLALLPGEGGAGIRRGYLWMLIGDDRRVKPDRMVLRWLGQHGFKVDPREATRLIGEIAAELTGSDLARPVTPWMVDHAIWSDARKRQPRTR